MRTFNATIAAGSALGGVGLATHTATSNALISAGFTHTSDQAGGDPLNG